MSDRAFFGISLALIIFAFTGLGLTIVKVSQTLFPEEIVMPKIENTNTFGKEFSEGEWANFIASMKRIDSTHELKKSIENQRNISLIDIKMLEQTATFEFLGRSRNVVKSLANLERNYTKLPLKYWSVEKIIGDSLLVRLEIEIAKK